MTIPEFTVMSMAERPDLAPAADAAVAPAWPPIIVALHEAAADHNWDRLWELFPAYQFVLLEPNSGAIMAIGNSLPLAWDGDAADLPAAGWDWAIAAGVAQHLAGEPPATQCAIAVTILPEYRGRGLSAHAVRAMRAIGVAHGLERLIAPVRPSLQARYPLTPLARYIQWQRADGLPLDPWLRVHARLGASMVKVCAESMTVTGTVAEWEACTGMLFPESGRYVVPDALVPVEVDRAADRVVYVEPNVWMVHALPAL